MIDTFNTRTVDWRHDQVVLIDQTKLPGSYETIAYDRAEDVAEAIKTMVVRGAPAIGATAALGLALAARQIPCTDELTFRAAFSEYCILFSKTRPTAVNLFWAIERMRTLALRTGISEIRAVLLDEALTILAEDVDANHKLGAHGASLLRDGAHVLTHCNAGALATVGYGTALGVIRAAVESGKTIHVFADETRPRLQGARLTAYELHRDGIDVTVICDNTAGYLMQLGKIDAVIVGADRIVSNGDTANKIGTYSTAVLAKAHGVPFYIAAPISTLDFNLENGADIPIEERSAEEVTGMGGERLVPDGVKVLNYAFDVTPAKFITAIITDHGIAYPPFRESLAGWE